jgi:hypothetical protein
VCQRAKTFSKQRSRKLPAGHKLSRSWLWAGVYLRCGCGLVSLNGPECSVLDWLGPVLQRRHHLHSNTHSMSKVRVSTAQHSTAHLAAGAVRPIPWTSANVQARGERCAAVRSVSLRTCKQQLRACFLTAT